MVDHDVHETLEGGAFARVERRQYGILNFDRDRVEPSQRVPAGPRQAQGVASPIVGIAPPSDETGAQETQMLRLLKRSGFVETSKA